MQIVDLYGIVFMPFIANLLLACSPVHRVIPLVIFSLQKSALPGTLNENNNKCVVMLSRQGISEILNKKKRKRNEDHLIGRGISLKCTTGRMCIFLILLL